MPPPDRQTLLIFPFNLLSHYVRCLQLAETVRDHFHILFAHSDKYLSLIDQAGFETFPCEEINPEEVMACAKKFDFSWLNRHNLERVMLSQSKCIETFGGDIVLGDTAPTLKMAADYTGCHYLSLMNGYMTRYYACVRKLAKDHPAARYADKLPKNVFDWMTIVGERIAFRQVHSPFKTIRRDYGLPRQKAYLDELEGDLNLICDQPELFPQHILPDNYRMIGPLYYTSEDPEPEIQKFMDNEKSSILVNIGSSGDLTRFLFLQNQHFKRYNIIVAGDTKNTLQGSHIFSKCFINNSAILPDIDLLLCHGGNGSLYQALAHGIPVICATSIFEQEWNAQRIVDLGLGTCIDGIENEEYLHRLINQWITKKQALPLKSMAEKIDVDITKQNFRQVMLNL